MLRSFWVIQLRLMAQRAEHQAPLGDAPIAREAVEIHRFLCSGVKSYPAGFAGTEHRKKLGGGNGGEAKAWMGLQPKLYDLVQNDHAGNDRIAGKMARQGGVVRRNGKVCFHRLVSQACYGARLVRSCLAG
ncbi:protein of unknown function [Methylocaldum szegediense]|uniref:Transposase n=1 Tax=Methylocaldum szegediense TaxID=73780 RepID=A0ABN8XBW6_9GAMM|nr:protein of unknown function [Methylocaldum szegediense]